MSEEDRIQIESEGSGEGGGQRAAVDKERQESRLWQVSRVARGRSGCLHLDLIFRAKGIVAAENPPTRAQLRKLVEG